MDEKGIKVSVILPVYNPGKGIQRCIDSLRHQSLHEIEILFIDDCGTDGAKVIIQESAKSDPRIHLIENSKNMGAGRTRNRGIQEARGKYLAFVDPDDYVSEDFLEVLYTKAVQTGADIVKGVYRNVKENGEVVGKDTFYNLNLKIKEGLDSGRELFSMFTFQHCTAIYLREMLLSYNVCYGVSNYSEDAVFLLQACTCANSIDFTEDAVYFYVSRGGSNVRDFSLSRWKGEITSLKEMLSFIATKELYTPEEYEYAANHIVSVLDLQKYFEDKQDMQGAATSMLNEIKEITMALPYCQKLVESNVIIDALVQQNKNISAIPFGWEWRQVPYKEYRKRVDIWVDFLCEHPEYCGRCQTYLWRVFENAIDFDGWKEETIFRKKESLKEIRKQAHSLPNKKILTDDFISMKLFIDYGIDTFSLRKTKLGEMVQNIAARIRK